jgi:putative ABC transport system permease protein
VIGRLLAGSLRRASGRLTVIALAATVAAATVAASAGLGARLAGDAASRLHQAGPNLLVRPQVGGPERLEAADVARVLAAPGVVAAAGVLELEGAADLVAGEEGGLRLIVTRPGAGRLAVVGVSGDLLGLHPQWEVERAGTAGSEARGATWSGGGALVGVGVSAGEAAPQTGETHAVELRVAGVLTTGEEPDRGVVVPLAALAGLLLGDGATDPGVDRIEVRAEAGRLEAAARAIEERVAGAEARPLVRVTETEARLVRKLQLLVGGVGAVCLLLALATVGSATLALLDDRRTEIALFLSLGYTGRWVQGLLSAELALVGLASVAAGGLLGEAGAAALARALLGEAAAFQPSLGGLGVGLAAGGAAVTLVVAAAAALVRRRVERLDPAPVLQGR